MRRAVVILRVTCAMLMSLGIASGDLAAFHASLNAMSCCAKTNGDCAGLKAPDDCCQSMGHGTPVSATALPDAPSHQGRAVLAVVPVVLSPTVLVRAAVHVHDAFKRPHDPTHLHPVPLLI